MLEIQDLTVRFALRDGPITALEHVDLTVRDGETLCIVGESGSGKSVLMQAILCLLPQNAIITGKILLDGEDLLRKTREELTEILGVKMSYVPQGSGNSLNPLLKLGFQVGEGIMEHQKIDKKTARQKSVGLFKRFHLGDEEQLADSYPHTLSGGMRQRVLLALGVAPEAPLLAADEPTKGLDSDRVELVAECFRSLSGTTLLCVTHDLDFAERIADRVAIIYAGQLIECEATGDFFRHPRHPYSQALLAAMPERGLQALAGFSPGHDGYAEGCRFYDRCPRRTDGCRSDPPPIWEEERMVKCIHANA